MSSYLYNNKVVILIGQKGVLLGAFANNKLIAQLFVDLSQQENLNNYSYFLKRFGKFKIFFLLDNIECQLINERIPTFQSFWKLNALQKFIKQNFLNEEIVACQILDGADYGERNATLAMTSYIAPFNILLEYVLEKKFPFQGTYFFDLEMTGIIRKLASNNKNHGWAQELQIFVLMLGVSGLKFIAIHNANILNSKTIPYPADKSNDYLQGLLSKEINDQLIALKSDIEKFALKPHLFFLLEPSLKNSFTAPHNFGYPITFIGDNLSLRCSSALQNSVACIFTDLAIMNLLSQKPRFLGINQSLQRLAKFNLINSWMFKPLILIVALLVINLIGIQVTVFLTEKSAQRLHRQNAEITRKHQALKTQFPYLKDDANLVDLFSWEKLLKLNLRRHINFIEKFFAHAGGAVEIEKFHWQLANVDDLAAPYNSIQVDIMIKFYDYGDSINAAEESFSRYLAMLAENFRDFDIEHVKFVDKIYKIGDRTVVPAAISIRGPRE